jgi:fatty acid desaturase
MNATQTIDQAQAVPLRKSEIPDDRDMLRTAAELTRDIAEARPEIYWPDMLASALIGYGALAATIMADSLPVALLFGVVSVMALYRALLFIHELTHIHRSALPGFRFTWNLLVGIPMLTPSFGYEGVHTIHHSRMRYGTAEDPEYLPLALMKPWTLPLFILFGLLAPVLLIARFAVLVPLGLIIPPLRRLLWERFSALSINPFFRRRPAEGEFARMVRWQEAGASIWAIFVLAASALWLGWRPLLIAMIVLGLVATFNQLRTLVAHLWENDGERMTVTAQYLDSVNVPHWIAGLWAPVGLRYHATHHLLPSLPYHSLGEAHKRISAALGPQSTYQGANHKGMLPLVVKIARSSMGMKG